MSERVRRERHGDIAWIVIDRPEARNALSFAMFDRLAELVHETAADSTLRGLIVTGTHDVFVAGADIAEFRAFRTAADFVRYEQRVEAVIGGLEALEIPTIAALAGPCTGGGVFLASACDLRIAAPNLRAGVPIARTLGNVATARNVVRLAAIVGAARAKEWMLTARLVDAAEALRVGFVSEVVASVDALAPRAQAFAEQLAGHAPRTMRAAKELYRRMLRAQGAIEDRDILEACYGSADFHEGVEAFLEKRPAKWKG
jgi:enoyl-CoA hydratase/carnithine racemase